MCPSLSRSYPAVCYYYYCRYCRRLRGRGIRDEVPRHVQDRRRGQSAPPIRSVTVPPKTQNGRDPRSAAFRYIGSEARRRNGLRRFAPRLVAPNHNETCQGAYLRGHLKSDFYLRACRHRPYLALFSPFLFPFFFPFFRIFSCSRLIRDKISHCDTSVQMI